jgi:hypothetical protein
MNLLCAIVAALLGDVRAGGLTSADFYERLIDIHSRHLGDDANSAANEMSRIRALRAFEGLSREAPSRHHELERLPDALGTSPAEPHVDNAGVRLRYRVLGTNGFAGPALSPEARRSAPARPDS